MDEGTALVRALRLSRVHHVLQACSMCQCVNMLASHGHGQGKRLGMCLVLQPRASCVVSFQHVLMFQYAGCARAWMKHAPQYVPCAAAARVVCCEFIACVNVSIC